jgi:molybdopterin converting factor small subunit
MFKKLRIKLFGRSKKEIYKDMNFLLAEISDDLDDIRDDLDDLYESVKEGLRLTLIIQEQCQQIIEKMEKKEERTLEEIVDNIEKLVGKDNAKE